MTNLTGTRIGQYNLIRKLGAGGMGAVYEGVHIGIGQRAAIKVLHPHLSRDPKCVRRFIDEARLVSMVGHPGLVKVYDFTQSTAGTQSIVMEFLEGESLWDRFLKQKGRDGVPGMPVASVMYIGRQVASALASVHARGIVHRDLKPDNIMLVSDPESPSAERVKILDFGIAKLEENGSTSRHTTTGTAMGTPTYMAPEQIESIQAPTDRLDVYALGVILFELLAGQPPFQSESTGGLLRQHLVRPPPPLPPHVPPELRAIVEQALSKEPTARPTMQELARGLEDLLGGVPGQAGGTRRFSTTALMTHPAPSPSRRRTVVASALLLFAVLGVLGLFLARKKTAQPRALPPVVSVAGPESTPKPQTSGVTPPVQASEQPGTGPQRVEPSAPEGPTPKPLAGVKKKTPRPEAKPTSPLIKRYFDLPKTRKP